MCGAGWGERSPERTNRRNGYRSRTFETPSRHHRAGHPQAALGQPLPDWLLEPRRRTEWALVAVVAQCTSRACPPAG